MRAPRLTNVVETGFEGEIDALNARIRKLESDCDAYMKDVDEMAKERNYWETRATTAEEKVKEWSIRACEAEERIAKAREIVAEMRAEIKGNTMPIVHDAATLHWAEKLRDALEGK